MLLAHRIRLDPSTDQRDYFVRAAGTARRVWNWALAEWLRQRDAGGQPNANALKRQFNAMKYGDPDWLDASGPPWLKTMHHDRRACPQACGHRSAGALRCNANSLLPHAQPSAHLARAWSRYFDALRAGQPAHPPQFKKKGHCRDSFYVANDKFRLDGLSVVLSKIGKVALREVRRLEVLTE